MKVFCAAAEHSDDPADRLYAFVVAPDREAAVRALRNSPAFDDYPMPPVELSVYAEDHMSLSRLAGARSPLGALCADGVYPIRELALIGG